MFTPPHQNTPTPRPPRGQDDWIAIVVALGILGGTAGWAVFNSTSLFELGTARATLSDVLGSQRDAFSGKAPTDTEANTIESAETTGETPSIQVPLTSNRLTAGETEVEDRDAEEAEAIAVDTDEALRLPAVPPIPVTPESTDSAVTVPEPVIPEAETPDTLTASRAPIVFSDLEEDFWAKPYIDALTARGVLSGLPDGTFAPNRPVTRAELAAQLAQAFDVDAQKANQEFSDISENYWATEKIQEAVTTGFMSGYPEKVFRPDQAVPRVQALVSLAAGLSLPKISPSDQTLARFSDQTDIPAWATDQVASAIEAGFVTTAPGNDGQLRPNAPATRAEVAAMLYSGLVYLGRVDPID